MNTKATITACLLAAGVITFAPVSAIAQAYPTKPVNYSPVAVATASDQRRTIG